MNAPIVPQRIEHWPLARLKPYVELDPVYCDVAVRRGRSRRGRLRYGPSINSKT